MVSGAIVLAVVFLSIGNVGEATNNEPELHSFTPYADQTFGSVVTFLKDNSPIPIFQTIPIRRALLRRCNGLHNLCDLRVNSILFATMHNANSNPNYAFLARNHKMDILTALNAGIRGLNLDIGKCNINGQPSLALVHSKCFLGFADPVEVFREINQFLMDNPDEVILMPCQINNDTGGTVLLGEIYAAMQQAFDSGGTAMSDRLYAHPGVNSPWPTLAQLIDMDKRILFFHYNGENCATLGGDCPRGFHDWFTYAAETRFAFRSVRNFRRNPESACTITRGGGGTRDFFGINVFMQVPSRKASRRLNSRNFLADHIRTCAAQNGLTPNAILIDFWEEGDVLAVVHEHNSAL